MKLAFVVGLVALAAASVAAWLAAGASPRPAASAAAARAAAAAPVTRGDVTQRVQVEGTLGYAGARPVLNQLPPGILTAVARTGSTLTRGQRLFSVAGTPVALLYGTPPAYRDFVAGMADGDDVRALERNLVALGMDPFRAITVDDHFDWATTAAILRWQIARGLPPSRRTGTIPLGHVVFLPRAVRVDRIAAAVGSVVGPGVRILVGSSTRRVVVARVTTDQRHLVRAGDRVRVTLPTGRPVRGRVTRVGRVATSEQGAAPGSATPAVPVTVALRLPARSRDLDQAPVQVAITSARRRDVLMVPVTALLAKLGGGYQVRMLESGGARRVDVRPGLYDDTAGTVEIAGTGVREGATVEVPAP